MLFGGSGQGTRTLRDANSNPFAKSKGNCPLDNCDEVVFKVAKKGEEDKVPQIPVAKKSKTIDGGFEHFYVCKQRLADFSVVFRQKLNTCKDNEEIPIDCYSPRDFQKFLQYVFQPGALLAQIPDDDADLLLAFADKYDVKTLSSRCLTTLKTFVSTTRNELMNETDGRYPVIEKLLKRMQAVKNSTHFSSAEKNSYELETLALISCSRSDIIKEVAPQLGLKIAYAITLMKLENLEHNRQVCHGRVTLAKGLGIRCHDCNRWVKITARLSANATLQCDACHFGMEGHDRGDFCGDPFTLNSGTQYQSYFRDLLPDYL